MSAGPHPLPPPLSEAAPRGDGIGAAVRKPKNIVVCCDGTGNEFGDANSNVVKLASTLVIDQHQVSYYPPGVGTMGSPTARNWLQKKWDVICGLAFGFGITSCIADAYHY